MEYSYKILDKLATKKVADKLIHRCMAWVLLTWQQQSMVACHRETILSPKPFFSN
jgi:hypothetical protein